MGNPLLLALYGLLPHRLIAIILWAALVIFAIDAVGTLLAMLGLRYRWAAGAEIENRLANFTVNTGMALLGWVEQRMNKAHPAPDLPAPAPGQKHHLCRRMQPV